jgi:hypothetical protein
LSGLDGAAGEWEGKPSLVLGDFFRKRCSGWRLGKQLPANDRGARRGRGRGLGLDRIDHDDFGRSLRLVQLDRDRRQHPRAQALKWRFAPPQCHQRSMANQREGKRRQHRLSFTPGSRLIQPPAPTGEGFNADGTHGSSPAVDVSFRQFRCHTRSLDPSSNHPPSSLNFSLQDTCPARTGRVTPALGPMTATPIVIARPAPLDVHSTTRTRSARAAAIQCSSLGDANVIAAVAWAPSQ